MKYALLLPFLLLLARCNEPLTDKTTTVPFWFGSPIDDVHSKYGTPNLDNLISAFGPSESYFTKGVVVEYSEDKVSSIELTDFTHQADGVRSKEKIHGISMDNELDDCIELWGEHKFMTAGDPHDTYTWHYEGNTIDVEVLNESGTWISGESYSSGDFRTITITQGLLESVDKREY